MKVCTFPWLATGTLGPEGGSRSSETGGGGRDGDKDKASTREGTR